VEDLEKKFPATQGERKKIMQHTIEKKISCKRERSKNIPTCNSYTDPLQYCVHRLARFCIFEQAHLLKRTHGVKLVNSGQHHRDSTAFGASNLR
jgi:hypothetical protein